MGEIHVMGWGAAGVGVNEIFVRLGSLLLVAIIVIRRLIPIGRLRGPITALHVLVDVVVVQIRKREETNQG